MTPRDHRPYLDGLRGVAILMVVMVHASIQAPGLPDPLLYLGRYGVRGVQLFFIVSGLTLAVSHAGKPLDLPRFALRRFLRIAPMFYLGAALYLILAATTALPIYASPVRPVEVAGTLAFVHGWMPSAINKVVPGGWSIAAEMMFYVLFPAILLLRYRRRDMALAVVGSYALAGATNLALKHFMTGPDAQGLALGFWLCHLPAFMVGCWLAGDPGYERVSKRQAGAIAIVAGALLILDSQLRHTTNLLVSITLLGLLVWSLGRARPRWLESGALPYLGKISFSLYIVHFAVVDVVGPLVRETGLGAPSVFAVTFAVTLLIAGALASLTYRYIETPFIAMGRRRTVKPVVV